MATNRIPRKQDGPLLREVARLVLQAQRTELACSGAASSTQCFVLGEVGRHGPLSLKDLAARLVLDKSWLSRTVDSLERDGLVVKVTGRSDKRSIEISLSEAGQKKFELINAVLDDHARRVLECIAESERAGVLEALKSLQKALVCEQLGEQEAA